jgi:hypothetical protein
MSQHNRIKKGITENDKAVLNGLRQAFNSYPFHKRVKLAWRLLWGRL